MNEQMIREFSDEELIVAAQRVRESLLSAMPSSKECEREFSQKFCRKMNELLDREERRHIRRKVLQKAAAILLMISIGVGGIMAISPSARAAVISWFVEWYETHVIYRYVGEDVSGELLRYGITELPDGYQETERITDPLWVSVIYENSDGGIIYLDYNLIQQGGANAFVSGDDTVVNITVNQFAGQLLIPLNLESRKMITWIDPSENIQFLLTAVADDAEMLDMAESVSVKVK